MIFRIKTIHVSSLLIGLSSSVSFAQELESGGHKPKIRGAIMMANSHVPHGTEGGKAVSIIPTWGFDVDYFFHPRWSWPYKVILNFKVLK